MTEVRTTSSTGGEKGVKPQRHSLIPKDGLDTIAEVFAFGAQKYDDHNWRRGYEWSKSYDALVRHLTAWWEGEDLDPESGLSHLGHAGFHILALATWQRDGTYDAFDDRYVPGFRAEQMTFAEWERRHESALREDRTARLREAVNSGTLEPEEPLTGFVVSGLEEVEAPDGELPPARFVVSGLEEEVLDGDFYGSDDLFQPRYYVPPTVPGEPVELGPDWQNVGYLDEASLLEPFVAQDLRPLQDSINRAVANLARQHQAMEAGFAHNSFTVRRNRDIEELPFEIPSVSAFVEWQDPEPRTWQALRDALLKLEPRFATGSDGVTVDFDPSHEERALANGWGWVLGVDGDEYRVNGVQESFDRR